MNKKYIKIMKIYINADKFKESATQTKAELLEICKKENVEITSNPDESDFICSIGGDGTFLKSSHISNNIPVLGINCGTVGYLTDISPKDLKDTIKDLKNNNYYIEERMMIEGEIITKDSTIPINTSLNEIALSKNVFGVVKFDTIVDGKLINTYTADGILICTPTGSTAYNLSCGGPIVDPTAEIITLTPIAPHTVINRSIVLSDKSVVEVKITELRENTTAYVLFDGKSIELNSEDIIRIRKSDKITRIVKLNYQSFIDTIREKIK